MTHRFLAYVETPIGTWCQIAKFVRFADALQYAFYCALECPLQREDVVLVDTQMGRHSLVQATKV